MLVTRVVLETSMSSRKLQIGNRVFGQKPMQEQGVYAGLKSEISYGCRLQLLSQVVQPLTFDCFPPATFSGFSVSKDGVYTAAIGRDAVCRSDMPCTERLFEVGRTCHTLLVRVKHLPWGSGQSCKLDDGFTKPGMVMMIGD